MRRSRAKPARSTRGIAATRTIFLLLACIIVGVAQSGYAQPVTGFSPVNTTGLDVRGGPVVLTTVGIDVDSPGRAVVHFDGLCVGDVGDRIVLAASDNPDWSPDNGNVAVEAFSSDVDCGVFSHTRSYRISPGLNVFYAVAENYVEMSGNGLASIYGGLTVEFFPDDPAGPFARFQDVNSTNVDLNGAPVVLAQQTIDTTVPGRVLIRFDGLALATPGDRIVIGASDDPDWHVNDGNVDMEAIDTDLNSHCFSHTRAYDVGAGSHTFYAVAENYVETAGDGIASIYGGFTLEFFPDVPSEAWVQHQGFTQNYDLRGAPVDLASVSVSAAGSGKVLVRFDGVCISTPGDLIVIAASDHVGWTVNDGNVAVQAYDGDITHQSFSHSRLYQVSAGVHDFHAVGQNYVRLGGTGSAWFYGNLTATYFPDGSTSVSNVLLDHDADARPGFNEISWRIRDDGVAPRYRIMRTIAGSGEYVELPDAVPTFDGSGYVYRDTTIPAGVTCRYRVMIVESDGEWMLLETDPLLALATKPVLSGCSPNPFNATTTISFDLPQGEKVRLAIYDATGRIVRTLVDEVRGPGHHMERWDGRNDGGRSVASGVYVGWLEAGAFREATNITLVK